MVGGVQQGPVQVGTLFMVAADDLPPTAAPGTWALMRVESVESTPDLEAR